MRKMRLPLRLFLSYAVVVLIGAAMAYLTVRLLAEVTDTGVGLSEPDLERVFERFYRAPGQPRRSAGSGIGLTIARGIARGHGGDVTAASVGAGQGASFTVVLPLRTPHRSGASGLLGD